MNHILDPCYGCQPYTNCKTICDKQMFYNLYLTEKQKLEQIENTFHSKIDECFNNFFDHFEEVNNKKLGFKDQVVLQQFIQYLKQNT